MNFVKCPKNSFVGGSNCHLFRYQRLSIHVLSLRDLNRLFPSCLLPRHQNASTSETIHAQMRVTYKFIFMKIQNSFSYGKFCTKTRLKQKQKVTRKWPIEDFCMAYDAESRRPMSISIKVSFPIAFKEIEKCRPALLMVQIHLV